MKDSTYKPNRSGQAKNFLKAGAVAGATFLGTLFNSSEAYSQKFNTSDLTDKQKINIQRGISAPTNFEESKDSVKYTYPMNKYLRAAVEGADKPYLILQNVEGNIAMDNDTSELYITVPKSELGKKAIFGVGDRSSKYTPCEGEGLGSNTTPLASFATYLNLIKPQTPKTPKQPKDTIQKKPEKPKPGKLEKECCPDIDIDIDIHNNQSTNNFYGDTTKTEKPIIDEKACSDYRFLPEAGKYLAKPFNFVGGVIQKGLGKDFWLGIYGRKNLGTEKTGSREDWDITTPLEPEIGLETNSTGFKKTETELSKGLEGGLKLSYAPGILDIGLGFGAQETSKKIYNLKKGFDNISQNGKIINEKPFCVESEEDISKLNYVLMADINANLFKGVSLGLEGRVNDLFNKPNVEAAVKASIELGGCKDRRSLLGGRKNEN